MNKKVYIPSKVKIGFQEREDTYSGILAYLIYYDAKGQLRKKSSWENWCWIPGKPQRPWGEENKIIVTNKKLTPYDFDNVPHSGFVINKGVQRFGWDGYGNRRKGQSKIRVYDDRGFEFEITVENMALILMNSDCLKRGLIGEFVYAWYDGEIILLPTNSEEYREASEHSSNQKKKVSAKEVVEGCLYTDKSYRELMYLGRYKWSEYKYSQKSNHAYVIDAKKKHIFYDLTNKNLIQMSGFSTISTRNTDYPDTRFPELLKEFSDSSYNDSPVEIIEKPLTLNYTLRERRGYIMGLAENSFIKDGESYRQVSIKHRPIDYRTTSSFHSYRSRLSDFSGYIIKYESYYHSISDKEGYRGMYEYNYYPKESDKLSKSELEAFDFVEIFIKFESGKLKQIT